METCLLNTNENIFKIYFFPNIYKIISDTYPQRDINGKGCDDVHLNS